MANTKEPVLISYENDPTHENSQFFFETVKRNNWELQHVGAGEKWEGFITKIKKYRDVCATYDKDRILVLSDARDVFCVRDSKAFTAAFEYFKTPILISSQMFLSSCIDVPENFMVWNGTSLDPYFKHWNIQPKLRKFICSGLIAGRAGPLYEMWNWILDNKYTDDQLGACMYTRTFPEKVKVDHEAIVLHSSEYGVDAGTYHTHYQKMDAPTFAEIFGTGAFFIHIPGLFFKGQAYMYKCIKKVLQDNNSDSILKLYSKPCPAWDPFKDLP